VSCYLELEKYNPGDIVRVKLLRDERTTEVEVRLDAAQ